MADLNSKQIAEQIETLAKQLKTTKDVLDSVNDTLNITKTITIDLQKIFKRGFGPTSLLTLTMRDTNKELMRAKSISEKVNALKLAETNISSILVHSSILNNEELKKTLRALEQVSEMRHNLGQSSIMEVFGLKRAHSILTQLKSTTKNYGDSMEAAGSYIKTLAPSMGKFGKVAAGVGGILASMGPIIARLAGPIGIAVGLVTELAKAIFNVFKQADDAAMKFRMTMGITRSVTGQIDKDVRSIAIGMASVGVTFDMAYNSIVAIAATMGSIVGYAKDMSSIISLFTAQLGISAEKSTQTLKAFAQISRSTMSAQRNMLGFVAKLSQAGGTTLSEVMGDIAEFSQSNYRFMRSTVSELAKATVEARRMGTSLGNIGKSANSLLNFTQSINDEMEASVLLGRSIDLQRARSLSYAGDLGGLSKEILRLSQDANFESMDPIQMQSFAKALGMSESEISKMLVAARDLAEVERQIAKDPILKARELQYRKMIEMSEKDTENVGKQYILDLQREANQTRMLAIQQQWNALIQKLAEYWLPAIDAGLKVIVPIIELISNAILAAIKPFTAVIDAYNGIKGMLKKDSGSAEYETGWKLAVAATKSYLLGSNEWIFDKLVGMWKANSPHKIGQMYVDGFTAAGPLVERSLVSSMTRAAAASADILGNMGFESTGGRTPPGIGAIAPIATVQRNRQNSINVATDDSIMKVVESINRLREDMLNGKIGANVRLDSQVLAESTARATNFRGGYGTNNARV